MDLSYLIGELVYQFQIFILPRIIDLLIFLSPFYIPLLLINVFWPKWVSYVREKFFLSQETILLEVKVPRDNPRPLMAMEIALESFYQTFGEATWIDKYWSGKTRSWFSLEITSIEGQVKFYIWMRKGDRAGVEASFYSQFPSIEIREVEDYTKGAQFEEGKTDVFAVEMQLTKADPYPIKTYVDYGLDRPDVKDEFKVDPLTPLIEFLGSLGVNQQIWIQIIIRAHKKETIKKGHLFKMTDKLRDEAEEEISKIKSRNPKTRFPETDEKTKLGVTLTKGEDDTVSAIERALHKKPFDVGIRTLYFAKKENFSMTWGGGMIGLWKQFGSEQLNGFKPNSKKYSFAYSDWNDPFKIKRLFAKKQAIEDYKSRSIFYTPHNFWSKIFVLNTEELATIFHFPSKVSTTPTFERIASKRGEPPNNLPI